MTWKGLVASTLASGLLGAAGASYVAVKLLRPPAAPVAPAPAAPAAETSESQNWKREPRSETVQTVVLTPQQFAALLARYGDQGLRNPTPAGQPILPGKIPLLETESPKTAPAGVRVLTTLDEKTGEVGNVVVARKYGWVWSRWPLLYGEMGWKSDGGTRQAFGAEVRTFYARGFELHPALEVYREELPIAIDHGAVVKLRVTWQHP